MVSEWVGLTVLYAEVNKTDVNYIYKMYDKNVSLYYNTSTKNKFMSGIAYCQIVLTLPKSDQRQFSPKNFSK